MQLDIDQILSMTFAWDFSITVNQASFATRCPSVGELGLLGSGEPLTADNLKTLISALFDGATPDVTVWNVRQLTAFLAGYLEYFQRWADHQKKLDAAAASAKAAVAQQMPPAATSA